MITLLRILKWLLLGILGLIALFFLLLVLDRGAVNIELSDADKAAIQAPTVYTWDGDSSIYYALVDEFGKNKKLAEGYEIQCLFALSHYPELKETPIDFIQEPFYLQLSSRPDPITVLFPWVKRKYLVVISTEPEDDPILLKNTPFNEQVGILGHELAHVLDYQDESALQLVSLAYSYLNGDAVKELERATDKSAIAHGLGYQLYDFAFYVRIELGGSTQEEIEADEGGNYLSPKEIAKEMEQYDFYLDPLPHPSTYFDD